MPRPKRQKVAPSAPSPRPSQASQLVIEVAGISPVSRETHADLWNINDAEGAMGSAQPVVKKRRGRPPKRKALTSELVDGTLGSGHVAPEIPVEESLLGDINLDSSSPSVELGRRDRNSTTFESSSLSIANFRRRPRQPSILGRGPQRARSSSVESSNQVDSTSQPSMASRNISALSIGNFRRRPRQPSILGRARSSSVGFDTDRGTPAQPASTLRIGNFKRRARESSVLGTSRKPQQDRAADDEEDEEDFNPEDESTPLNLSKTAAVIASSTASSSNPRKRKLSAETAPTNPAAASIAGVEDQEAHSEAAPLSDEAVEEDDMPSSPPGAPIPSIEAFDPVPMSETMAPPQSSSSPRDSPESPPQSRLMQRLRSQEHQPRGRRPVRGRTPVATQDSPISSPPPLTHSPNRAVRVPIRETPKPRARRQAAPPSTFSTAQLQSLLPQRRRQPNRDPYDVASSDEELDVSGLASDDDELTNLSVAPQPRRPANLFIRRPAPLKKNTRSRAPSKSRTGAAPDKATYGSRPNGTSDKENEEYDPDDSLAPLPDDVEGDAGTKETQGDAKELKEAAKKFKEVDKWELDFEDVTASSSSPIGAR